jgi:hypothetical protein
MICHRLRRLLPIVVCVACSRTPASPATQPPRSPLYNPPPVVAWLDCVECTQAQLDAVAAQGDAAVPELKDILFNGPPAPRLKGQQGYLERRYQTLKDYERLHPDQTVPWATQQAYVQAYLQKFVLLNRGRAARALGAIGTRMAKDTLTEAKALPGLAEDLRDAIDSALGSK